MEAARPAAIRGEVAMQGTPPVELAALIAAVQGFVRTHFPGAVPEDLIIHLTGSKRPLVIPIPAVPVPAVQSAGGLTDRQADVMQVLEELPEGQRLTGKELSQKAGYEYDSAFRADLAALVRMGRAVNHNPGYGRPES